MENPMSTTDYPTILTEVQTILGRFARNSAPLEEETELVNDLGLDSLLVMEIIQEVEDAFDISFPLNNLSEIRTVREFALQIQQELEAI
jgi:acyl carrier protein